MIEEADRRMKEWVGRVVGEAEVILGPPDDRRPGQGASIHLLEVRPTPPAREANPPLQLTLRYLVTTWSEQPEAAHNFLGRIAFAAMEQAEFELEPEPPVVALWSAFGVAPRPAIVFRVMVRRERVYPRSPAVREPLVIRANPSRPIGDPARQLGVPSPSTAASEVGDQDQSGMTGVRGIRETSVVPISPPPADAQFREPRPGVLARPGLAGSRQ